MDDVDGDVKESGLGASAWVRFSCSIRCMGTLDYSWVQF